MFIGIDAKPDYDFKTTFWQDFSIADRFGIAAVKDTYNRAFNEWKFDVDYVIELSMVLNHKIWQHYETNQKLAEVYDELWRMLEDYVYENFTEEQIKNYIKITD